MVICHDFNSRQEGMCLPQVMYATLPMLNFAWWISVILHHKACYQDLCSPMVSENLCYSQFTELLGDYPEVCQKNTSNIRLLLKPNRRLYIAICAQIQQTYKVLIFELQVLMGGFWWTINYWISCHKMLYRHSWSPEDRILPTLVILWLFHLAVSSSQQFNVSSILVYDRPSIH